MQKFFVSLLSLLTLTLIVAVVMAIRVSIPQKKDIDISYEEAFEQAKEGNAKIVPILIRAWSDDSRTGNDNWRERWGEGEIPNSKHTGEQYDEFSKKVIASFYYIGAKNTLPYIFKELKNYDESKRRMAKRVIQLLISRNIVDKECFPVIMEGLKDKNDEIRHISTILADTCGLKDCLEIMLKDKNKIIRYEAAFALSKLSSKNISLKPILLSALKDNNPQIRQEAIRSLAVIGKQDQQMATKIIELLDDEEVYVINSAIETLGILGDKRSAPKLIKFLTVEYPNLQLTTITALGELGDKSAIPSLKQRLNNITSESIEGLVGGGSFVKIPAKEFRKRIGIALCNLEDEKGIELVKEFIPESSGREREEIIKGIANVNHKSAIPFLTRAFLGKEFFKEAMEGLVKIGTASIPAFQMGLSSKDSEIQRLSIQGLGRINDESSAIILSNLLANSKLKDLAITSLVNLGTLSVPILTHKLASKNINVQCGSIIALGKIGDITVKPILLKKLQSKNPQIRLAATEALGLKKREERGERR